LKKYLKRLKIKVGTLRGEKRFSLLFFIIIIIIRF
jgi:hypothetical protein